MQQTIGARHEGDEGTEVSDARHLAGIELADLGLGNDALDVFGSRLRLRLVLGIDAHAAIIIEIDIGASLFTDLADGGAALADHVTHLVGCDLEGQHRRGIVRDFLATGGQHLIHLREDGQTCLEGLFQRLLKNLLVDPLDLDVHLQRGNAFGGPRDLEVHVAEVILIAEDIGQYRDAIGVLDQPHGDTRDRRLERHTGVHQRKRGATHGRHRARTIGFGDLGDDTDRVGEGLQRRQHGFDAPARQTPMADLTPLGRADEARLADAVGREVVVQHEAVLLLAGQPFDQL